MKLNTMKWNQRRLSLEAQIKTLKESIREGGHRQTRGSWNGTQYVPQVVAFGPGMGTFEDYRCLENMKLEATGLYCLRAFLRGKQHQLKAVTYSPTGEKTVQILDADSQKARAEGWLNDYGPLEEPLISALI